MSQNIFDPKLYKHVKSDKHSTTLKHKKGHTLTIAHNVISPKMRSALEALSKIPQENATESQAQEAQDQHQYGKVMMKADGGSVMENDPDKAAAVANYERGSDQPSSQPASNTRPMATRPSQRSSYGDDAWPSPSQTSVGMAQSKASGGKVESNDHLDSGTRPGRSTQGEDVRNSEKQPTNRGREAHLRNAKIEAKGRAQFERHVKPKMQGLAEGGNVNAPGGPVDANFAYEHGLPCRNPACKSNGRPHPNCRCYSFAEGGEVQHVCGINLGHYPDCEYYSQPRKMADGGVTVPYGMRESDIPKDESQTENEISQYEAQNPSRLEQSNNDRIAAKSSPMLQPGMPGYQEPGTPINDAEDPPTGSEEQTDPRMYQKIHGEDNYGRMPAEAPQEQAQPMQGADAVQSSSDAVNAAQPTQQPVDPVQEAMQENKAWENDLMNGHITPKTYNDLMYHNKDGSEKSTLGKIGSIFGLILSGMGSGLTHQPNMAMQMMDNTIKNDLESQKHSKENSQNYLRVNQARLLNDANVQNILSSSDYTQTQKDRLKQEIDMKAYTQSYMQMKSTAMHKALSELQKMPEGPEKQKATQVAMMMAKQIEESNLQTAVLGAAGMNALSMYGMDPNQQDQQDPEKKFQNDMQMRENAGDKAGADSLRERHIPGVPGFASAPVGEDMRNKFRDMNILDNKVKDVLSFAQKHRGSIDPRIRAQARQKAEELTSFYNKSVDTLGLSKGRLGWLEEQIKKNPTSIIEQMLGNNSVLREIRDSNAMRKTQQLHDLGFPDQQSSSGGDQKEQMSKSGKPMIFKNGRWEYK